MVKKTLLLLLFLISCTGSETVIEESKSLNSEEVLNVIFESYKNFSDNPEKAVDVIWGFAHEDNKEITGPKERFAQMLVRNHTTQLLTLKNTHMK